MATEFILQTPVRLTKTPPGIQSTAMIGMPEVHRNFARRFPKDKDRLRILKERWPSEFTCPKCLDTELPSITARRYLMCRKCGQTISITAGTLFHGRHLKLSTWDRVIKALTDHDRPVSASQLSRELKFRRRQTLISMLAKLRELMRQPNDPLLTGAVHVDTLRLH
jgi:transcription elongation factor Elf1